ncbi:hypothetical protein EIN_251250 [Entamoeba invadens IP1]|uniref:Uncharacterized protein n=1 Tax=Entamoeba invadens IP1 TaxID=370355 RepID=A0A0A1UEG6_ENTIV|nr:hypothetical protein EIN_251250 [Entamoeba invadens IP1]ELP94981.1 hypothetical protein EIN_251250 [Entamoeba invadens IP1]|eukprot:XP_004261752.1 hypothetical protein EIN_251250 [Entamoeba invadens IP1]
MVKIVLDIAPVLDHITSFEKYGGFLIYIFIIFQLGYCFHYIMDRYIIPTFNGFCVISIYILHTKIHVPFLMSIAHTLPEIIIVVFGVLFNEYYALSAGMVIGCVLCGTVVCSGVTSFNSHNPIKVNPYAYERDSIILLFGLLLYSLFAISLHSNNGDDPIGTMCLWISFGTYLIHYVIAQITTRMLSRSVVKEPQTDVPSETEGVVKAGLVLVKSSDYSEAMFTESQWAELWVDIYMDEIVVREGSTNRCDELFKVEMKDIKACVIDDVDSTIFEIVLYDRREIGMRSSHRAQWVGILNCLISNNKEEGKKQVGLLDITKWSKIRQRDVQGFEKYLFFVPIMVMKYTIPRFNFVCSGILTFVVSLAYLAIMGFGLFVVSLRLSAVLNVSREALGISLCSVIGIGMRHIINGWNAGFKGCGEVAVGNGYYQGLFNICVVLVVPWTIFYVVLGMSVNHADPFNSYVVYIIIFGTVILITLHLLVAVVASRVVFGRLYGLFVVLLYAIIVIGSLVFSVFVKK